MFDFSKQMIYNTCFQLFIQVWLQTWYTPLSHIDGGFIYFYYEIEYNYRFPTWDSPVQLCKPPNT